MEKDNIINFVTTNTYFFYEGDENDSLTFTTRENGSVLNETASDIDIKNAVLIKEKLLKTFDNINVELVVVDEWVSIVVSDIKLIEDEFKYRFIKDLNGQGFTETFKTMDILINKYGHWVDVDWDNIKTIVNDIVVYPESFFNGWCGSDLILLKRASDKGNKWGYNFFIQKTKKNS